MLADMGGVEGFEDEAHSLGLGGLGFRGASRDLQLACS